MKRFECMQALAGHLENELVILSLGASVDEWYSAAPHMRAASLFQQQLGCVTPQAFGLAVGLPPYATFAQPGRHLHPNDQDDSLSRWLSAAMPWDAPDPM